MAPQLLMPACTHLLEPQAWIFAMKHAPAPAGARIARAPEHAAQNQCSLEDVVWNLS